MSTRKRKSRRGAALPEAAIVLPTMMVFLGAMAFSQRSYETKLDIQTGSRNSVLSYASNGCAGGGGAVDLPADTSTVESMAGRLRSSEQAGVSRILNFARSGSSKRVQEKSLARTVTASSAAVCNEKRYDNHWTALIEFALDFTRSGGGIVPGL